MGQLPDSHLAIFNRVVEIIVKRVALFRSTFPDQDTLIQPPVAPFKKFSSKGRRIAINAKDELIAYIAKTTDTQKYRGIQVTTFTILTDCIRAAILTNDISTLGRLLMLNLFPETTQVGGPHYILPFSQLEYYGFLMMSLYWERYEAAILIHGLLFRFLFDDKTLQDIGDRLYRWVDKKRRESELTESDLDEANRDEPTYYYPRQETKLKNIYVQQRKEARLKPWKWQYLITQFPKYMVGIPSRNEVSDFKSVQDLYYTVSDYSDFTKDSVLTKVKEAVAQLQQVAKTTELTQEQNPPANWSLKNDESAELPGCQQPAAPSR
ncbi:hypothetical protein BJ085DRAFT_33924 [Dimargaris cristalligena]|uniref:Uncharacterized protein n=1 Tax=Dimargaris cristalligena TaxID=215637 RepID=A0A4P9ZLY5_9FUNG|nr:hypothetical protein BJ085DRAFT_33924 [Dimargaris cristalligena]|eukprot:RKP33622.1 hypothetical protein BJ085DRAFT_33924 [Dimargaris cristalligena]